jgi:hypothetical protein
MIMRGLPQELFVALLFGAAMLVQFLYRELRRKAASMQAQVELEARPVEVASAAAPDDAAPPPAAARPPAPPPAPKRLAVRTPPQARRFSRAALMPDRRAVQNAVVIAAILQPCHAQRTRDNE